MIDHKFLFWKFSNIFQGVVQLIRKYQDVISVREFTQQRNPSFEIRLQHQVSSWLTLEYVPKSFQFFQLLVIGQTFFYIFRLKIYPANNSFDKIKLHCMTQLKCIFYFSLIGLDSDTTIKT